MEGDISTNSLDHPASLGAEEKSKLQKTKRYCFTVWTAVGAILLTAVAAWLLMVLSIPVGIILWSIVIIFCLRGPVNRLEKMGVPRGAGTAIAYLLMFMVVFFVGILMFSPVFGVGDQFSNLVQSVPSYVDDIVAWTDEIQTQYAEFFSDETMQHYLSDALDALGVWASSLAKNSVNGAVAFGTGTVNTLIVIGFALVVAFWILMELPALGRECARLVGPKHVETADMLHVTFTRIMGGFIKGTLLQCSVIGVGCGVVFGVLGIPNYAALGGIAGLLNVIPIVGPWLGGALAAIVGVFVDPWVALVALVATIVIQQVVYTFVSPKIMATSVDVHPALTLLALMAGSALGGAMGGFMGSLVGMLVSIPAVAVSKAVFVYYFEKRTGRQLVSEDGVFFQGVPASDGRVNPIADATSPHPQLHAALERSEQRKAEARKRIHQDKQN